MAIWLNDIPALKRSMICVLNASAVMLLPYQILWTLPPRFSTQDGSDGRTVQCMDLPHIVRPYQRIHLACGNVHERGPRSLHEHPSLVGCIRRGVQAGQTPHSSA